MQQLSAAEVADFTKELGVAWSRLGDGKAGGDVYGNDDAVVKRFQNDVDRQREKSILERLKSPYVVQVLGECSIADRPALKLERVHSVEAF